MLPLDQTRTLLGGITPAQFLAHYWQKKPLLIRQALPAFAGFLTVNEVKRLASREDVESRLIERVGGRWTLTHGPISAKQFKALDPKSRWTVLIQDLNTHRADADELLRKFSFIPWARVDDVMVSYATPGAGVGPHVDSYDVFLIQGAGRRRWQISTQDDLSLKTGLPLKILKHFKPEDEWVLEPGDMLYLPPNVAHDGVALDDCFTYSIGFRAPSNQEWVAECLMDRAERDHFPGHFEDPHRKATPRPGELPLDMVQHLKKLLTTLSWTTDDLIDFNGRYLSEPKAQVYFEGQIDPVSLAKFKKESIKQGLKCDAKTRLLYRSPYFWCNGERFTLTERLQPVMESLADTREALPHDPWTALMPGDWNTLYELYMLGWIHLRL